MKPVSQASEYFPNTVGSFVWRYLRLEKKYLFGFFMVALIWAAEMSLSPYLLKIIINIVVAQAHNTQKLFHAIAWPIVLYVVIWLILNLNFRLYDYINLRLQPKLKAKVQKDVFAYVLAHSYAFFQNHFVGSLTRKVADLVSNIEMLIAIPNEWFVSRALAVLIASMTLFKAVHPIFGGILLVWAVLFAYFSYVASKHAGVLSKEMSEASSVLDGSVSDAFSNVMSIKLFGNIATQSSYVAKHLSEFVKRDRLFQWYNLKIHFVQGLGVLLLMIAMLAALLYGLKLNFVSAGDFALVLMLSRTVMGSMYDIAHQMQLFSKVRGTCAQALSLMNVSHEIKDSPDASVLCVPKGEIKFTDVVFSYENQTPVFEGLNVQINPGEKVGLVGYSGAGKSTFIKLILRLFDTTSGKIYIDGQAIQEVTLDSLRQQIGTISQEPELFHQSILENIKFAKPDASDKEVIEAAKKAKCHDFIMALPKQYEALVGERGVKLSGGQKQRMAIARAFLKNAPILLLDEATSSLDSMTERDIHAALHDVMKDKTTLVIAHRLATLKDMDRILVFVDGKIEEDGSLNALLSDKNSIFYTLWQMQSEGFISDIKE